MSPPKPTSISKYIRGKRENQAMTPRSVNLTPDQHAFIDAHDINLSLFVREKLDEIMAEALSLPKAKR